ncbi:MAG: MucR family transcriptional regulator [Alphaproteobacteria bacterium]|nr:MucR family transcriptional regulator [Alphaproteobacteria bacterium]
MNEAKNQHEMVQATVEIVSAHVSNNSMAVADIPGLIEDVYQSLMKLGDVIEPEEIRPEPVVPIKKSITPDYLICLEDGKKLKMLKRHLKTAYDMSPEEYRDRWGLPADYPMVAPNYAKQRSELAKSIGLGTQGRARRRR